MKLRHIVQEGGQALHANKLRSALTIIGIVVGIFAVTAMLALGEGLSQNIEDRISSMSSGDISVQGDLTMTDFEWIRSQLYTEDVVATLSSSNPTVIISGTEYSVSVSSPFGDYLDANDLDITKGEVYDFNDPEYEEKVVIVSSSLEDAVVEDGGQSILNQKISIGGLQYTVIGIFEESSSGFMRNDGTAYIPYKAAVGNVSNTSNFSSMAVYLVDSSYYEIAGKHILEGLNASRHLSLDSEDLFSVSTAQSMIESVQETSAMISLFLGVVGGIALFVGGIGTMNMMLTSVTERTKEIGLRKAIGARNRDILLQILAESVFLTMIGGIIGILITYIVSIVANKMLGDSSTLSLVVSSGVVIFATSVAIAVGVIFGLYPARNASKLQPVDALRTE